MPEIKLSLDEILEEIDLHDFTEDNREKAIIIITLIFKEKENVE